MDTRLKAASWHNQVVPRVQIGVPERSPDDLSRRAFGML